MFGASVFSLRKPVLTLLVAALAAVGCASASEDGAGLVGETHYILKLGPVKKHPKPLPDETPILVERFLAEGGKSITEGFRGWDVNGDGRFEMVEVLDEKGGVQARLFDFDGDGRVDAQK